MKKIKTKNIELDIKEIKCPTCGSITKIPVLKGLELKLKQDDFWYTCKKCKSVNRIIF